MERITLRLNLVHSWNVLQSVNTGHCYTQIRLKTVLMLIFYSEKLAYADGTFHSLNARDPVTDMNPGQT